MSLAVLILPADAYRMVDALRDYSDILEREGSDLADFGRFAADRLESAPRSGGLIEAHRHDVDAAHSAVVALMVEARQKAEDARAAAVEADAKADRFENFLGAFTV